MMQHAIDHVVIHCDSIVTLAYMKDQKYYEKSTHIETCYHYIRDVDAQRLSSQKIYLQVGLWLVI